VRLARTRLPVDEDAAVVAFKRVMNEFLADCVEDVLLLGGGWKDAVETEGVSVEFDLVAGEKNSLVVGTGTDSHDYLN
jgi:hypothetical protein